MRLSLRRQPENTWEIARSVWLENVGKEHIMLRLPTGDLRLDIGRRLRFRSDILDRPEVKAMIDNGAVVVSGAVGIQK